MKIIMLVAILALSLFVVGCSSNSNSAQKPPPSGGGCGVASANTYDTSNQLEPIINNRLESI